MAGDAYDGADAGAGDRNIRSGSAADARASSGLLILLLSSPVLQQSMQRHCLVHGTPACVRSAAGGTGRVKTCQKLNFWPDRMQMHEYAT